MPNALLIRLDKIGDLVVTLPADEQPALQGYDHRVVAKGMGFVPAHADPPRRYFELSRDISWDNIRNSGASCFGTSE